MAEPIAAKDAVVLPPETAARGADPGARDARPLDTTGRHGRAAAGGDPMRLPSWVHSRTTTRVAGKVTITLTADTSGFEASMRETASIVRYQAAVAHQRDLGRAYVGVMLDELARSVGLDPVEAAWLAEHRAHGAGRSD